jgi:PAS domain S-box-containing protein
MAPLASEHLQPPRPPLPGWVVAGVTALAYLVVGRIGAQLALPSDGVASLLFPASGLALAALIVGGRAAALGLLLGALALRLWLAADLPSGFSLGALLAAPVIALGVLAQALAGRALVHRHVGQPLVLTEPLDLLLFYLYGGALACLVSPTVGVVVLALADVIRPDTWAAVWLVWWTGDLLGVLIGAPLVLTVVGQPRRDWAPRVLTTGVPLLVALLLLGAGTVQLAKLDDARRRDGFEREATAAASVVGARLQAPLRALEAAHSVFVASPTITHEGFRRASAAWLRDDGELQSLGWAELVARERLASFEAAAQAEGLPGYRVLGRAAAGTDTAPDPVLALRYIEPQALNASALGVDLRTLPVASDAVARAVRSGRAVATPVFALPQGGLGTVIYRPVFHGSPATPGAREQALRGVVFASVRPGTLWLALREGLPTHLSACLIDLEPARGGRLLAGDAGCAEAPREAWRHVQTTDFGGRRWELHIVGDAYGLAGGTRSVWPFVVVGQLAAAVLGALLLTMTGRRQRIEREVAERTAALTHEMAVRGDAEAALGESEKRFRVIFDAAPVGMVYTDMAGRIRQTNPAFSQLTGYGREELLQMTVDELTHAEDRAPDERLFARLAAGEVRHVQRSKRIVHKGGEARWVRVHLRALDDVAGRPTRMVGVLEDITEHLRLQDAERARERAEAANRAKSEFVSRMSHELRTPLNAMLGFAQLLELDRDHPLAGHQTQWTQQIQHAGWHLLSMINDTLDLSRIESGNLKLQLEPLDVGDMLHAACSLVAQDAQRRGVTLELLPPARALRIEGDMTRVKQILTNLLSNAIKYNVDGGLVRLTSRLRDTHTVELEVADTGLGMTAQQLADLFQPFNRLGREGSDQEGTGIGLVISQRLAQLMGGSLDVRSTDGEGSVFTLVLPRASGYSGTTDLGELDWPAAASYHRRRIHYIEDNATNAEVMRGIVAQRPQIRMDVSCTGLDGLAAVRRELPDLVLLDMHLPDIDGLEVLRELTIDPATADIPVLVVSADAGGTRHEAAMAAGAAQYLTKPVGVAQMLAALDRELERMETRYD